MADAAPIVVLVRPQLAENIGFAMRALANFGFGELRIVSPRDGWPHTGAEATAAGARASGLKVHVFDSVADAVADCQRVTALTRRPRRRHLRLQTLAESVRAHRRAPGRRERMAVLFGPERAGLDDDDISRAQSLIAIPVSAAFPSLNLGHAVAVFAYAWATDDSGGGAWQDAVPTAGDVLPQPAETVESTQAARKAPSDATLETPANRKVAAPHDDVADVATEAVREAFFIRFRDLLVAKGYFRRVQSPARAQRDLRHLVSRMVGQRGDFDALSGMLTALATDRSSIDIGRSARALPTASAPDTNRDDDGH